MSQRPSFLPLAFPSLIPVISLEFLPSNDVSCKKKLIFLSEIKVQSLSNSCPIAVEHISFKLPEWTAPLLSSPGLLLCFLPVVHTFSSPGRGHCWPLPGYSLEQSKNAMHAHLAENKAGEQWVELLLKTALESISESDLKWSKVAEQVSQSKETGGFNSVALLMQ